MLVFMYHRKENNVISLQINIFPKLGTNIQIHCPCFKQAYAGKTVINYLSQSHHLLNYGVIKMNSLSYLLFHYRRLKSINFRTLFYSLQSTS